MESFYFYRLKPFSARSTSKFIDLFGVAHVLIFRFDFDLLCTLVTNEDIHLSELSTHLLCIVHTCSNTCAIVNRNTAN